MKKLYLFPLLFLQLASCARDPTDMHYFDKDKTIFWDIVNNDLQSKKIYATNITYSKKYGDVFNPYQSISLAIESKDKNLDYFRVENLAFDNNEIVITEEEAINIAVNQDEKIISNEIESTKANLMIVKMNSDAYERISNIDEYYKSKSADYEDRKFYSVDERVRFAWVVVITYKDIYGDDVRKRYTEGQYSYFVDSTTGEIIGGHVMDYRNWY